MAKGFRERMLNVYSNFMKFVIQNTIFNLIVTLMENMPLLYAIDSMFSEDILSLIFSPFYFLCPTIYLEKLNEGLSNECTTILTSNNTNTTTSNTTSTLSTTTTSSAGAASSSYLLLDNTTSNSSYQDIKFFNNILFTLNKTYCLYSSILVYLSISIIGFLFFAMIGLAYINPRKASFSKKGLSYSLTNLCNLLIRPFGVLLLTVLFNKPLLLLYQSNLIIQTYFSMEIVETVLSVLFIIAFCALHSFYAKYINNSFFFEKFPYDYYSKTDGVVLLFLKVFVALSVNFQKFSGLGGVFFVNLILGILIFIRFVLVIINRKLIINHLHIKTLRDFMAMFFTFYIILKFINQNITGVQDNTIMTLFVELAVIIMVMVLIKHSIFESGHKFTFCKKEDFIEESLGFFYYIGKHIKNEQKYNNNKTKTESIIDNLIIGHKMKCILEDCILCPEDIYNPNLKTLFMILYQQFLRFLKDLKKEDEEMCLIIRLLFLRMLDEKKVHRISFVVLKNSKVELTSYLKMYYLYYDQLDNINFDLKNLLTIKYGEIYDELLQCIGKFEEVLGFIKSRTEKVEQVIMKTNQIGNVFNRLIKDLYFLKKNKRVYYDSSNLLQIICIIRLLFQRNVDAELTENLEYNFNDFLEHIDRIFDENRSFMVRYDFANSVWRIKKIPKLFIDITKIKISEIMDQSIDKIFPHLLGKNIVQKLEELLLSNIIDSNLAFKTFVCDNETNVKYVKFDIDVVPNLEKNYILYMHCHFHKRQLLIVDEFGNFVNGSEGLYQKMGINSEIVAASKGKINMYNVFNLPKTTKLEEVKIVSISDESLLETAKKVFLLETNIYGNLPGFLNDFVKNGQAKDKKKRKERNVVYMNLFDTIPINEIKFYVFTIKISGNEDKKDKKEKKEKEKETEKENIENKPTVAGGNTINLKRQDSFNSSVYTQGQEQIKKNNLKKNRRTYNDEESKNPYNLHTYQNCVEYYNYFYDTHRSASITIDYNKHNLNSHNSSQNTGNSDLFSFLYLRNVVSKKRANAFENFLNCIYIFNFSLVVLGLFSIIFLTVGSNNISTYLDSYFIFNNFRIEMYKTTANFFPSLTVNSSNNYASQYSDYIKQTYMSNDDFDFDYYLRISMQYYAENAMTEVDEYNKNANNLFSTSDYNNKINYNVDFIYFNSIGNYMMRQETLTSAYDLFSLTANELATSTRTKTFLNISLFDFTPGTQNLAEVDKSKITIADSNYFQTHINIYQYFFNYFSVFYSNLESISSMYSQYGLDLIDVQQIKSKVLLIIIVILNVIFVLISFFSIFIYRKILLKEFNTLYSFNEEHLNKLKEKYKYVRELIKVEHAPSKIYSQLRKMKEVEAIQFEGNKKMSLNGSALGFKRMGTLGAKKFNQMVENGSSTNNSLGSPDKITRDNTFDDLKSVMTNNETGMKDVYLKFSGAKSALVRSNTVKVKKKIEKIKKENNRVQASLMLLRRLNFQFELITKFIYFISFMSIFYILMGYFILQMLQNNFDALKISLNYSNLFLLKYSNLYNYYTGVKLSIMFNKPSPYTTSDSLYNETCTTCNYQILTQFNNATEEISILEATYPFLSAFQTNRQAYSGSSLCQNIYSKQDNLINYLKTNSTFGNSITTHLSNLCSKIPILQSNVDTVFTNMNVYVRQVYDIFELSDLDIEERITLVQNELILNDILFGIFAEPYLSYVKNNLLVNQLKSVLTSYSGFMIAILIINIFIDFLILFYVWFKIYKQIIASVNNIHLVTDSVSTI